MSFTTPGTIEYRLVIAQVVIVGIAFVLLVANKLPMKWAENFYKFSNYLFFGWLIGGSIVNWVITGNLNFIISYVYPYIAIPMLASSIMYGYKNWRELRQMKRAADTYAHSVTYVTDNILRCLQDIVRQSGLSPGKIASDWEVLERGIKKWIETKDLEELTLEVFNPKDDKLIGRWDFTIYYGYTDGSGSFYVDTEQVKYAIRKAGVWASEANYRIVADTKPGTTWSTCHNCSPLHRYRPDVAGWSKTTYRSTEGFVIQSIGTTIEGAGLSAVASYWRLA